MRSRWGHAIRGSVTILGCLGSLLGGTPAHACPMPPPVRPPQGMVGFEPFGGSQPRNVALFFVADADMPATEAIVKKQITVEVSLGGVPVAGSVKPIEGLGESRSFWHWGPDGGPITPAATYHVKVINAMVGAIPPAEPIIREYDVPVVDGEVRAPELALTVDVRRYVAGDETAPQIGCSNPIYAPCTGETSARTVATRYVAKARFDFRVEPYRTPDEKYISRSARVFARTNGVVVEEHGDASAFGGYIDLLKADEYCVSVSAWVKTDPEHPLITERCVPRADLDLSMSEEDQKMWLEELLLDCVDPNFPPGYGPSAPAPAPAGEPSSSSSCAAAAAPAPARQTAFGATIAAGLLALIAWRRRGARRDAGDARYHRVRSRVRRVSVLLGVAFTGGCVERSSGATEEGATGDAGGGSAALSGDAASCRNVPLPPTQPAPESIVGTWLLESFDETSSGSTLGNAWHIAVSRTRPLLSVTFAADGTWEAARCGEDQYDTCSAWCGARHGCMSGTYTYVNGQLDYPLTDGTRAVYTTETGIAIPYFWGPLGWANFVKIEHLTPCR